MTLEESIKHCMDIADYDCFTDEQRKCSEEHQQLADWLRELKERREKDMTGDLISRQTALTTIEANQGTLNKRRVMRILEGLPSAESEIIHCKDCRKHNVKVGFDENFNIVWKEDACPMVDWRGKAKGHEFDYQFCCCAERRTDE